ncbi:Cyclin-dependent kinase 2 [Psilocybe cubensis]|uniref:cyclin-dependent kinase n=2 Tax=Psilocybe cubensis TaxID=181762 RepID=A0A8H7Y8Z3_PSICU|nr:Cyclin-dependent kinase 2 [Psilocybe cubensis]KAH9486068.1 Cyclin-dependent kinase 2 [Psilocybe cubensis]
MSAPLGRPKAQVDVLRILGTPGSHFDMIQEGPFATVSKTWTTITDGVPQWIVVKSATTLRKFAREPHDIVKELRLLSSIIHPNITLVLGSFRDEEQNMLSIYMPYFPISLSSILTSPYFSPHRFPPPQTQDVDTDEDAAVHDEQFCTIARSIMIQTLSALAFLHSAQRRIGHRDIKPENIMLTTDGCVKLIDFGVSWCEAEQDLEKNHDLWPEYKGKLYFEVSTRAYRAPELLFGSRNYDHCAIDLWSIGATFAEFFTPLRLVSDDEDDGDDDDDTEPDSDPLAPFIVPKYLRIGYPSAQWKRDTLFNGERGEIGLAWSIFKIFGTPTKENWPDFEELPGSTSVVFNVVPAVPLIPLLPNLPSSSNTPMVDSSNPNPNINTCPSSSRSTSASIPANSLEKNATSGLSPTSVRDPLSPRQFLTSPLPPSSTSASSSPLDPISPSVSVPSLPRENKESISDQPEPVPALIDLISRFLVYPSASRIQAEDAMRHPWFTTPGAVLLLPPGYSLGWNLLLEEQSSRTETTSGEKRVKHVWNGRSLGEWIKVILEGEP